MRKLTAYEQMVFNVMASSQYTADHVTALANAKTEEEFEAVVEHAVDRYEDWVSDLDWVGA